MRAEGLTGGQAGRWPAATGTGGGRGVVSGEHSRALRAAAAAAGPRAGHGSTEACPGAAGADKGRDGTRWWG